MTTKITPSIIACLGDSLTQSSAANSSPWPAQADKLSFPRTGFANCGKSGDTAAGMWARYQSSIKSCGFKGLILMGGINDVLAGTSASAIWTPYNQIITDALGDGLPVLCMPTSPFSGYSGWSAPKQTEMLALRALILARPGISIIDLYLLMAAVGDATALRTSLSYGDGLHYNPAGNALIAPLVVAAAPALLA